MVRKTHRSKSHKRRHSRKQTRRHTRKRGGSCPCSGASAALRGQFGGRGGMGGADLGHAFTTGASQELYQMTGRTPGLSSGGSGKGITAAQLDAIAKAEQAKEAADKKAAEEEAKRLSKLAHEATKKAKKPNKLTNNELKAMLKEMK